MSVDTDRAGIGASVGASIQLALGNVADSIKNMSDVANRLHRFLSNPRQSPIVRPLRGVVTVDAGPSTYMLIDLGGPMAGRYWDLRRLSVVRTTAAATDTASDVFTAVANVIIGLAVTNKTVTNAGVANVTGIDDWIILASAANNPLSQTWSAHEATIRFGQRFVVAIKAGTAADQWSAYGQAEEYIESAPEVVVA